MNRSAQPCAGSHEFSEHGIGLLRPPRSVGFTRMLYSITFGSIRFFDILCDYNQKYEKYFKKFGYFIIYLIYVQIYIIKNFEIFFIKVSFFMIVFLTIFMKNGVILFIAIFLWVFFLQRQMHYKQRGKP